MAVFALPTRLSGLRSSPCRTPGSIVNCAKGQARATRFAYVPGQFILTENKLNASDS